jgi:hypothetical protein
MYWAIDGVPGGGVGKSSEIADAGETSVTALAQMTAM